MLHVTVRVQNLQKINSSTPIMPPISPQDAFDEELLPHLALERVSVQWAGFLGVLSDELQTRLDADGFNELLVSMGQRLSQAVQLPACEELGDVEAAVNKVWAQLRWGYAKFKDNGQSLVIEHHACPLPAALQVDTEVAAGFLLGAYAGWLRTAGAPSSLELTCLPADGRPMCMAFQLAAN